MHTKITLIGVILVIIGIVGILSVQGVQIASPSGFSEELDSPQIWLSEDVQQTRDEIRIPGENITLFHIANTNSMDPVLDTGSQVLVKAVSVDSLAVGDIIVYRHPQTQQYIIHRIIGIGLQNDSWYAITKGDNNHNVDQYDIFASDIVGVVVGILY